MVSATVLLSGSKDREAGSQPPAAGLLPARPPTALPLPTVPGEPPIPAHPNGKATLSDPTITQARVGYQTPDQWCSVLGPDDVREATGYDQFGTPDSMLLCTHHLVDREGYFFVSDIPAAEGAPYAVRGNTALIYQSEPGSCEVSVVLNATGGLLDVDLRGVTNPRVSPCQSAVDLAGRVFDRLPVR